jgi:hypothetical protein
MLAQSPYWKVTLASLLLPPRSWVTNRFSKHLVAPAPANLHKDPLLVLQYHELFHPMVFDITLLEQPTDVISAYSTSQVNWYTLALGHTVIEK